MIESDVERTNKKRLRGNRTKMARTKPTARYPRPRKQLAYKGPNATPCTPREIRAMNRIEDREAGFSPKPTKPKPKPRKPETPRKTRYRLRNERKELEIAKRKKILKDFKNYRMKDDRSEDGFSRARYNNYSKNYEFTEQEQWEEYQDYINYQHYARDLYIDSSDVDSSTDY